MEWISDTLSSITSDLVSHATIAVIAYFLHLWRTRTLSGRLRALEARTVEPTTIYHIGNVEHFHAEDGQYGARMSDGTEVISRTPIEAKPLRVGVLMKTPTVRAGHTDP